MVQIFEGHSLACQEAEMQSRKEGSDVYVVKVTLGGLRYIVTKDPDRIQKPHKLLNHYNKGNKIK